MMFSFYSLKRITIPEPDRYKGRDHHQMTDDREVWDREYARQGRLWAGTAPPLPPLPAGSRVLELGCGNGKTCSGLLVRGWDALALDFSPAALRSARKFMTGSHQPSFILADARSIPFKPASCDAVIAFHVIGHMLERDRIAIAQEICRVIRDGGTLLFAEFSISDLRSSSGSPAESGSVIRGNGIRTHYFTEEEVRSLFTMLECISMDTRSWNFRVRGQVFERSEVHAVFTKGQTGRS